MIKRVMNPLKQAESDQASHESAQARGKVIKRVMNPLKQEEK
ncbi:hypothetical protein [Sporosarcina sp. SAFN-010]